MTRVGQDTPTPAEQWDARWWDTPVRTITAGIATADRTGRHDEANRLRTVLKTTKLARSIREAVDMCPPLTTDQIAALRALLPLPTQDQAVAVVSATGSAPKPADAVEPDAPLLPPGASVERSDGVPAIGETPGTGTDDLRAEGVTDEVVEMAARRMAARHLDDEHPQAFDTDFDKAGREYWLDLARVALEYVIPAAGFRRVAEDPETVPVMLDDEIKLVVSDLDIEPIAAPDQLANDGLRGVRITHRPTGLSAESVSWRSALRNKAAALHELHERVAAALRGGEQQR